MPEYPEFAWVEGIVNALTHRNYSIRGEYIRVSIYDDRLEILSPGLLPNIVTLENMKNTRFSRNPRIARVLSEFGWVKEINEGVKRIFSEMEKLYLKEPNYSQPNKNVLLVLENNVLNRSIRVGEKIKSEITEEKFKNLNIYERMIIQSMYNGNKTVNTSKASEITGKGLTFCRFLLKNLEKKDLIKWYGTSKTDKNQFYRLEF